ncbi:MAG: hypothetical protein ACR2JC_12840 [Chloroflexota bacterium]|nr:MAG: hypothetical protein DLM70_07550 [Chloroflexota bacterium]
MSQTNDAVTLANVLKLARRLSPIGLVRLIEEVAPAIERELAANRSTGRSMLGLLRDLGTAPGGEEIEVARQEAWGFPRDDV